MSKRDLITAFWIVFITGAVLCLGIALTTYPWHLTAAQTIGLALIYLVVNTAVAALVALIVTR